MKFYGDNRYKNIGLSWLSKKAKILYNCFYIYTQKVNGHDKGNPNIYFDSLQFLFPIIFNKLVT